MAQINVACKEVYLSLKERQLFTSNMYSIKFWHEGYLLSRQYINNLIIQFTTTFGWTLVHLGHQRELQFNSTCEDMFWVHSNDKLTHLVSLIMWSFIQKDV